MAMASPTVTLRHNVRMSSPLMGGSGSPVARRGPGGHIRQAVRHRLPLLPNDTPDGTGVQESVVTKASPAKVVIALDLTAAVLREDERLSAAA
jgi:hypothetical protein